MERQNRPTLDYVVPATAREAPRLGEDVCLVGAFVLYALANIVMVQMSGPGTVWDVFFAFTIPLPLLFITVMVLVRYFTRPPLFSRMALVTFILLVLVGAVFNACVFAEALAGV
jgi:hypothetical protein